MIAGRLRVCLKILRWDAADLADELGRPEAEISAWLDGRSMTPLPVAAWIEALVKAHRSLALPGRGVPLADNDAGQNAEIRLPATVAASPSSPGLGANPPYPRRQEFTGKSGRAHLGARPLPNADHGAQGLR